MADVTDTMDLSLTRQHADLPDWRDVLRQKNHTEEQWQEIIAEAEAIESKGSDGNDGCAGGVCRL